MTQPGEHPDAPRHRPARPARPGRAVLALIAVAAASALLGLCVGLIWSAVAPRALLVVQSRGAADVVNVETSAFIVADAWFCLLTAIGGLVCGVAGYFVAVRRYGGLAVAGLVLGGLGASALAMWAGQRQGLARFHSLLASSPAGTRLRQPLALGAHSALAFWPLLAALVVGSIELFSQSAERRRAEEAAAAGAPVPRA